MASKLDPESVIARSARAKELFEEGLGVMRELMEESDGSHVQFVMDAESAALRRLYLLLRDGVTAWEQLYNLAVKRQVERVSEALAPIRTIH